ncbi:thioredoxin domain-containing protein [Cryobacterium sp. PH31-L1]|uniref:DsbA family protein n=1 Tax=Cryobacterium sp. PH31-L1 TaxID=3046199 RepID=UPI0024BA335B|nr:thioredoxin domain-containing protein [Cryobacterium sp. PH31-L1]MDJ0377032.1 thioredoxin domain-containing protein [Cryobacterium sp. PH31-L1]
MTIGGPSDSSPSKNRRRDAARVKAKQLRVSQKKKDRRNKLFLQGGIAIAAVAIVALVSVIIVNSIKPAGPGPKNMASDGAFIGEGMVTALTPALQPDANLRASEPDTSGAVANIRIYVDYLCPLCGDFEDANNEQIANWVDSGAATVEIHPVAILTSKSAGTKYSLRAANAAACVANYSPNDFFAFSSALFVDQPEETSPGRSNDEIKAIVKDSGVSTAVSNINSCIDDGTYESWVKAATNRALDGPIPNSSIKAITSAPTVLVNGKPYTGSIEDPKEFASFVQVALGETYSTSTPTPEPTPGG